MVLPLVSKVVVPESNVASVRPENTASRRGVEKYGFRQEGLWVGIAGNQTVRAGGILRELKLPTDMIATSDDWGVAKPDPGFFRKMIEVSPVGPDETLYVGDRLDNDIAPAARLGLRTALTNRGPWATIWRDDPAASQIPTLRIDSLAELPGKIAAFNAGAC